jgi:hypothetical protein
MFNAINGVTDIAIVGPQGNIKWNCEGLKSSAKISKGMWCCEVAIPLKEFVSPVAGMNFMRNRQALLSHASLVPDPHNPKFYSKLYLTDEAFRLAPAGKMLLGRNFVAVDLKKEAAVTVSVDGKKQFEKVMKKGLHAVPVDLIKEGRNDYSISVRAKEGKSKPCAWTFSDTLPKALSADSVSGYYFSDEKEVVIKGRVNMNLIKGDGTQLAVKVANKAGKVFYQKNCAVTGNDFQFSLIPGLLVAEENYTVTFSLLIKGKTAGSETRSFYLMKNM